MEASHVKGKKTLQFEDHRKSDEFVRSVHSCTCIHCNVLSKYNIHDLDIRSHRQSRNFLSWEGVSVIHKIDKEGQSIIRNIALKSWAAMANACFCHELLAPEFNESLTKMCLHKRWQRSARTTRTA